MGVDTVTELETIVAQAKMGDEEAFERLYKLTCRFVYFHAKTLTKNEDETWDLVQETYMTAFKQLNTLREDRLFQSWLSGILFHLGYRRLRKKGDLLLKEEDLNLEELVPDQDWSHVPEEALERKETIRIIWEVIEELPSLQRAAVIAYYVDEMKISDIAQAAQCSEGTIKSRLSYARKAMKERILQKEREMGCTLHSVSAPLIVLALHEMFLQTAVPAGKAAMVWGAVAQQMGLTLTAAKGSGSAAGRPASSAAIKAGLASAAKGGAAAAVNIKLIAAGTAAAVMLTAGAAMAGVHIVRQRQETETVREMADGERPAEAKKETLIENRMETSMETPAEIARETGGEELPTEPGWVETGEGWKYWTENGEFIQGRWEEIDGELYYFRKDGRMQTGEIRLGNRLFTLSDSGPLVGVEYIYDQAYYEEDEKYYEKNEGLYASRLDGSQERKLCDVEDGVWRLAADEDEIFFYHVGGLSRIKKDGSNLRLYKKNPGTGVVAIDVENKVPFVSYSISLGDEVYNPHGIARFESEEKEPLILTDDFFQYSEFGQLQATEWEVYFIHDNPDGDYFSSKPYRNVLFRISNDGRLTERISDENIDAFFVHGNTAYCMQYGKLKKLNIFRSAEEWVQREEAEALERSGERGAYMNFLAGMDQDWGEFACLDVDQDGVEELLYSRDGFGNYLSMYVYQNGQVVTVLEDVKHEGCYYDKEHRGIRTESANHGVWHEAICYFNGTKWEWDGGGFNFNRWPESISAEEPLLSFDEFNSRMEERIAQGDYFQSYTLERSMEDNYQDYVNEWESMNTFWNKYQIHDSQNKIQIPAMENNAANRAKLLQ